MDMCSVRLLLHYGSWQQQAEDHVRNGRNRVWCVKSHYGGLDDMVHLKHADQTEHAEGDTPPAVATCDQERQQVDQRSYDRDKDRSSIIRFRKPVIL